MDIEECVAYNADGELYSHVEQVKDWKSYKGTMYVADIDICEAGITSCYGNCTCKYTGESECVVYLQCYVIHNYCSKSL